MILEFAFLSTTIRQVTLDKDTAYKLLGPELASDYFSLIADMRDALFLGELVDAPGISHDDKVLLLAYQIRAGSFLEVEPLGKERIREKDWESAFRVRLRQITSNSKVLA